MPSPAPIPIFDDGDVYATKTAAGMRVGEHCGLMIDIPANVPRIQHWHDRAANAKSYADVRSLISEIMAMDMRNAKPGEVMKP